LTTEPDESIKDIAAYKKKYSPDSTEKTDESTPSSADTKNSTTPAGGDDKTKKDDNDIGAADANDKKAPEAVSNVVGGVTHSVGKLLSGGDDKAYISILLNDS